jgi:hypothetical protein
MEVLPGFGNAQCDVNGNFTVIPNITAVDT